MISMKDIALECGVSVATVSKALNGQQDIGEETRQKIAETAERLGYTANSAARALKTNKTFNIGVLFLDPMHGGLAHEFFSTVLDAVRSEAESNGYDITFINRGIGNRETSYLQHCRYRGVDGVIIASADFADPQIIELVNSEIPVVTIDHIFNGNISIISDNTGGMETLTDYIISKGHKKIAFIHGEKTSVTVNRLSGFYRSCEKHGIKIPDEYVREGVFHDPKTCYSITKELLALKNRPTCIIFPDDYSCIGGINAVWESGLRIPDDISAAGYDGIPLSRIISPELTTWVQNTTELGRRSAARLIEQIQKPKSVILDREIVRGHIQEGASVKDISQLG